MLDKHMKMCFILITGHLGNENEHHNGIHHKIIKMAKKKRLTTPNVEDVMESKFSYIAGGSLNWYN